MVGRQVSMKFNPDSATELTQICEREVISILRSQKGFRDETTFIAAERGEAIANSFWDTAEDAEAYGRNGYPKVLAVLAHLLEETPTVKTFNFATSTFDRTVAGRLS